MKLVKWTLFLIVLFPSVQLKATIHQGDSTNQAQVLSNMVNSKYDEQMPIVSPDGKNLYFTRKGHPLNVAGNADPGDIWMARKLEDGNWGPAFRLDDPVNNKFYNGIIGFGDNGNSMYLMHHYEVGGKAPSTQGISISKKYGNHWGIPEKLGIDYFYNRSKEPSMRLSEDGRILLLSIESYDTRGAEDLYVSFKKSNGNWTKPLNLGDGINSKFQEMTPYLAPDNKTLYFASNGHKGFGSRDIFVAERQDDSWKNWTIPENMGKKINSKGVELSYHISSSNYAYFVSTLNSEGFGDIRRIKIEEPPFTPDNVVDLELHEEISDVKEEIVEVEVQEEIAGDSLTSRGNFVTLQGKVVDAKDIKKTVKALLFYQKADDRTHVKTTYSDEITGMYEVGLLQGSTYLLTVSAEGYMTTEEKITTGQNNIGSIQKYYLLTPIEVGATIKLNNVLFEKGTSNLMENSYNELDAVVLMMETNPTVTIDLGGHTDNRGSGRLNLELSQQRVDVVKDYLVSKGIDELRITGRGYGGTKPIASNANEDSRKLNRRVEFTIISN